MVRVERLGVLRRRAQSPSACLSLQDVAACTSVLSMFHWGMNRGEVLRYAIAYALQRSRKVIRGLKEGLSEGERYAVADHVVAQLKERGDPWRLDEEVKPAPPPMT